MFKTKFHQLELEVLICVYFIVETVRVKGALGHLTDWALDTLSHLVAFSESISLLRLI
jgi:hypothetical protein